MSDETPKAENEDEDVDGHARRSHEPAEEPRLDVDGHARRSHEPAEDVEAHMLRRAPPVRKV